jgi:hypothetical protein
LRPRSFAWRRRQASRAAGSRAGCSKSWAGSKTGPRSAEPGPAAGTRSATGLGTRWVHGPACTTGSFLRTRLIPRTPAGPAGPATIEDGPSSLDDPSRWLRNVGRRCCLLGNRWRRRGGVDRARPGLGHNHTPRRRRRRDRSWRSYRFRDHSRRRGRRTSSRDHRLRNTGARRRWRRLWPNLGRGRCCNRTCRGGRWTHLCTCAGTRRCRSSHARRRDRRADFCAWKRRPGNDGASGWLRSDGRRRRRDYDPRLLPGLRNDPPRRRRRRYGRTLTWSAEVGAQLAGLTLVGRSLDRRHGLAWSSRGGNGRRARSGTRYRR